MTERLFRVRGVVPIALLDAAVAAPDEGLSHRPVTDRLRVAATRLQGRDGALREMLRQMIDAMAGMERELRDLQRHVMLYESGIALRPRLVSLGGDGMTVYGAEGIPQVKEISAVFTLQVRDSDHLLSVGADLQKGHEEGSFELIFSKISHDQRDLIVAWVFQQQAMERRRDLASADPR